MTKNDRFQNISESIVAIENNKKVSGGLLDENIKIYTQKLKNFERTKKELIEKCVKGRKIQKNAFRLHKQIAVQEFLKGKKILHQHNELIEVEIKGSKHNMRDLFEEFIEYLYLKEK